MVLIDWLISASVRNKFFVLIGVLAFAGFGVHSFLNTTFDAFPDLTNVQVQVLTSSPGMSSEEIETLVTVPIERAMGGLPDLVMQRSRSRAGISAITLIFEDGTDIWLARQMVKERLDLAREDIPPSAGTPEVAPPSTGLGEVYQFTLRSTRMTLPQLYRLFQRDVAPRLRTVDGVVEVNAWGGGEPRLEIQLDPYAMTHFGLTFDNVREQVSRTTGLTSGGYLAEGSDKLLLRSVANPASPEEIAAMRLTTPQGQTVAVTDIAVVRDAGQPTVGFGTADGEGEALFVMVQLLAGEDALATAAAVSAGCDEIQAGLPDDVFLEMIYDRRKLVTSALTTVAKSLTEGGLLVILVLLLLLGNLRAGLIVASVIPLSMTGAFMGLNLLGYSGNLMSLGAIDFGLIVDGTIVVVESIAALTLADKGLFGQAVADRAKKVAKPVFFAVGILLLVYVPILLLQGVEGKLFRPMALTVLLALATALVLTFTYVPAMCSLIMRPSGDHQSFVIRILHKGYRPLLSWFLKRPYFSVGLSMTLIAVSVVLFMRAGVVFVPRLEEGDMVVQTGRLPSISTEHAIREVTRIETLLRTFPEVERVASRTGAPAVATDPMGLEEADILVRLKPHDQWETADTLDGLFNAMSDTLNQYAPGAAYNFTQPIEMRFNELLEGIPSDVGIKIFGDDMETLIRLANEIATEIEAIPGAADVTPPVMEGVPILDIEPDPVRLARFGLSSADVLEMTQALDRGVFAGQVIRGEFRDDIVLRFPPGESVSDLPIPLVNGGSVPLGEVADIQRTAVPNVISRESGRRRVLVLANVRGRDLGSFVQEAQAVVAEKTLPAGYFIAWGGKYEQLRRAATRMKVVVPGVLFLILGVLYVAFGNWRIVALIFLNVPVAVSGGLVLMTLRDLPLSLSAVVGFIALFGIAVMNGIVMLSRMQELDASKDHFSAVFSAALERFRPVLMTASVAGIGFLPMALASGVGAEVQRPLATVVIGGLMTCTVLTLLVLPTLYLRYHGRKME